MSMYEYKIMDADTGRVLCFAASKSSAQTNAIKWSADNRAINVVDQDGNILAAFKSGKRVKSEE